MFLLYLSPVHFHYFVRTSYFKNGESPSNPSRLDGSSLLWMENITLRRPLGRLNNSKTSTTRKGLHTKYMPSWRRYICSVGKCILGVDDKPMVRDEFHSFYLQYFTLMLQAPNVFIQNFFLSSSIPLSGTCSMAISS